MIRRTIAQLVVRTLPRDVVAELSTEIVGTLLDAGERSRRAFVIEAVSVMVAGTVAHVQAAVDRPAGGLAREALGWAAVVSLARLLVTFGYVRLKLGWFSGASAQLDVLAYVLPPLVLLLWSIGRHRAAGVGGVVWGAWYFVFVWSTAGLRPVVDVLIPTVGFVAVAATPGRAAPKGRLLWVVPAAMIAINVFALDSSLFEFVTLGVVVCLIPLAPAFGLGTAISWSTTGLNGLIVGVTTSSEIELIACPLAALAVIAATRQLAPTRS